MNERNSLSETKFAAMGRHKDLPAEKAGSEGVGRALMTIYPAANQHTLPEDMKRLLNEIGWTDPENANNSNSAI